MASKRDRCTAKRDIALNRLCEVFVLTKKYQADSSVEHLLQVYLQQLPEIYNAFQEHHNDVVSLTEKPEEFQQQDEVRKKADGYYFQAKAVEMEYFSKHTQLPPQSTQSANLKLPKISIPVYSGNIKDWTSFKDLFDSLIHNNRELSNVQKHHYLVTLLSGEPLQIVKTLPLTDGNYEIAYSSLESRYNNKRQLATTCLHDLVKAPAVIKASPQELRLLLNSFRENLQALKNLKFPVESWDFILFYLLLEKLDSTTRSNFELKFCDTTMPTYKQLWNNVDGQCRALETLSLSPTNTKQKTSPVPNPKQSFTNTKKSVFVAQTPLTVHTSCIYCTQAHHLYCCPEFKALSGEQRFQVAKKHNLCLNCLSSSHFLNKCKSSGRCRICSSNQHHSLLHRSAQKSSDSPAIKLSPEKEQSGCSNAPSVTACTSAIEGTPSTVLLSTADVDIRDSRGGFQRARVLLDPGSMTNFISLSCLKRLGLPYKRVAIPVEGLNNVKLPETKGVAKCSIRPRNQSSPTFEFDAIVIPKICSDQPKIRFDISRLPYIKTLNLADPNCHIPGPIDVLLGAQLTPYLFGSERLYGEANQPVAWETVFGFVLQGELASTPAVRILNSFHISTTTSLEESLQKFWQIEAVPDRQLQSLDDEKCEAMFRDTVTRTSSGRFCVSLPFRSSNPHIGESYYQAQRRFLRLEARLLLNPHLYSDYSNFLKDYFVAGHMSLVDSQDHCSPHAYYIPHHCVLRPENVSTKLRVVFDASSKGSLGNSLNDELLVGPKLQKDIFSILLDFRASSIALVCDVRQMYRQILITESQRDYQRIIWRFNPHEALQEFRLNTVTYGVSSSPFLALRTLNELANLEGSRFPHAAQVIKNHIYVDDVVTSVCNLDEALALKRELIGLFAAGGFELRKWATNCREFFDEITTEEQMPIAFDSQEPTFVKVLGLQWNPTRDTFSYTASPTATLCTKRTILSDIAKIYDPLGFITPIVLLAKQLLQSLWSQKCGWDESPPQSLCDIWTRFKAELPLVSDYQIPRHIKPGKVDRIECHGFADASQTGYGAAVYFRVVDESGEIKSYLCCAKSKVSPLKTTTIPRLELLAAVLLSNLLAEVLQSTSYHFDEVCAWSDSEVVLAWLHSEPTRWKIFVGNRVSHIQQILPTVQWRHVPSHENPADIASRGTFPSQLRDHALWWFGPSWLTTPNSWPIQPVGVSVGSRADLEEKIPVALITTSDNNPLMQLLQIFSSLGKVCRIVAYMRRFAFGRSHDLKTKSIHVDSLELHEALLSLVKVVQLLSFGDIIAKVKHNLPVPKSFRKLSLFLDHRGLIRVGGRLRHAQLDFGAKHPLLLPNDHLLTQRIIEDLHHRHLHPGSNTLWYLLLQRFWVLASRKAITRCISKCVRCFRSNPKPCLPPMADLPPSRVAQVRAFRSICIDYAGPFLVTMTRARGVKSTKAYICVFVCCSVKAIHLELVSDLTSEAFLAAFQRFTARRGDCVEVFSDQGTNFVGASNLLRKLAEELSMKLHLTWHFNPPSAPHFNGLAEAGVKSVKGHLQRVLGDQILTYEELYTLLTRIEAVLNSRPLCPISTDPNDLQSLSPSHFLTLEPLNSTLPERDYSETPLNRLSRWQLIQQMHQSFWERWSREYLHTLQQRGKWHLPVKQVDIGTLVLVKHENKPPNQWELARIEKIHPGHDGIIRVVTLRGANGLFQRPMVKLCPLPIQ